MQIPDRPPLAVGDIERVREQAFRRRLLYGEWTEDLREWLLQEIGTQRTEAAGWPDTSACLLLARCQSLSTLYDRPPRVHRGRGRAQDMQAVLDDAGWQSTGQRLLRDVIGIREMHLYVEQVGPKAVRLHPVFPSDCESEPGRDPERLGLLRWWRLRSLPDGRGGKRLAWTADEWDIRDPSQPSYRVVDQAGDDISSVALVVDGQQAPGGGFRGPAYPFYDGDEPIIPVVTYHAARTGRLYDWRTGSEIARASLRVAADWTHFGHILSHASWPQRWMANGQIKGSSVVGSGEMARRGITTDPAYLLQLEQSEAADSPVQVGQWQPGGDVLTVAQAIEIRFRWVLSSAGLNPADHIRQSGDPRSGYALSVNREAQREAQRQYEPLMRRGDEELCRVVAVLLGMPTDGWSVSYEALPMSIEELAQRREHAFAMMDRGLMTRVQAYIEMYPGTTVEEAEAALAAIEAMDEEPEEPEAPEQPQDMQDDPTSEEEMSNE